MFTGSYVFCVSVPRGASILSSTYVSDGLEGAGARGTFRMKRNTCVCEKRRFAFCCFLLLFICFIKSKCVSIKVGVLLIKQTTKNSARAPARARPAGVRPVRARAGARAEF